MAAQLRRTRSADRQRQRAVSADKMIQALLSCLILKNPQVPKHA